jgi:hypothetical protein
MQVRALLWTFVSSFLYVCTVSHLQHLKQ